MNQLRRGARPRLIAPLAGQGRLPRPTPSPAGTSERPVRAGNGAALHRQHDVFGELVLERALQALSLLSEDYEVHGLRMRGNFPQAYSHVGLINAAFAASPRWSEVL